MVESAAINLVKLMGAIGLATLILAAWPLFLVAVLHAFAEWRLEKSLSLWITTGLIVVAIGPTILWWLYIRQLFFLYIG